MKLDIFICRFSCSAPVECGLRKGKASKQKQEERVRFGLLLLLVLQDGVRNTSIRKMVKPYVKSNKDDIG